MSAVAIRDLGPASSALLAALHRACFPDEPWGPEAMVQVLAIPGAFGFLASDAAETAPSGFALALDLGEECEILALGVLPAARRRGVAHALMTRILAVAAGRPVLLEVAEDNIAALALYDAAGFRATGRRPAYYRRHDAPAVAALTLRRPGSR